MSYGIQLHGETILLTGNGTSAGTVTIANTYAIYPGTKCTLWSNPVGGAISMEMMIVYAQNGTLYMRQLPTSISDKTNQLSYGYTDCSAYLVADGACLYIHQQTIAVDHLYRPLNFGA